MLQETRRGVTTELSLRAVPAERTTGQQQPFAGAATRVQADAVRLPFCDAAFEAVVAMRLLFHYADVGPIAREMARVCRPGGALVFDTASWSPRSTVALATRRWGGRVFVHPPARLVARLAALGLGVTARRSAFLVSPYLYRLLPLPLEQLLERLETKLPAAWHSRNIWQVRVGERR